MKRIQKVDNIKLNIENSQEQAKKTLNRISSPLPLKKTKIKQNLLFMEKPRLE